MTIVIQKVECARELNKQADTLLTPNCELDYDSAESIVEACSNELDSSSFSVPLNVLEEYVHAADHSLHRFEHVIAQVSCAFLPIQMATLESLEAKIKSTAPLVLLNQPIQSIRDGVSALFRKTARLGQSLERVSSIANLYGIHFDGSPAAITHLDRPDGIEEIIPGAVIDDVVVAKAQKAASHFFAELPISELEKRHHELISLHDRICLLIDEIGSYTQQLSLHFDGTKKAVSQLATLGQIASSAPSDLLDFRRSSLSHPRILNLVETAEDAHTSEKTQRESLSQEFYLDTLHSADELKAAIRTFRRGDSLFNIFNSEWRIAKKLFNGISKTKSKYKAAEYEALVSSLVSWMEHHASFTCNDEFKDAFGPLFRGVDTDFSKIRCRHTWYIESHNEILKHPGFIETIDLSSLDSNKIYQLAALSPRLHGIVSELEACTSQVKLLLGPVSNQLEKILLRSGWTEYNSNILKVADAFKLVSTFLGHYVRQDVSPERALEVLNAKLEILSAHSDFQALNQGLEELHKTVEPLLPGIVSIPCHRWSDYLAYISTLARAAKSLEDFVCEYGCSENTPADILSFFRVKLALDVSLQKLAVLSEKDVVQECYLRTRMNPLIAGK
ncbi:MAG: hypothetical protein Q7U40_05535 [Desulfatirhabdiaceae bacterium]|nr:hypothetical protein [Desulfatirhabdiaceae bacterium]